MKFVRMSAIAAALMFGWAGAADAAIALTSLGPMDDGPGGTAYDPVTGQYLRLNGYTSGFFSPYSSQGSIVAFADQADFEANANGTQVPITGWAGSNLAVSNGELYGHAVGTHLTIGAWNLSTGQLTASGAPPYESAVPTFDYGGNLTALNVFQDPSGIYVFGRTSIFDGYHLTAGYSLSQLGASGAPTLVNPEQIPLNPTVPIGWAFMANSLLYMGDASNVPEIDHIFDYATDTMDDVHIEFSGLDDGARISNADYVAATDTLYVNTLTGENTGTLYKATDFSNVLAANVPEPGAWALMIVGFGFAGATLRTGRRRARAT